MNRNEIRKQTCLIIRKKGEFLVSTILCSTNLRWSTSPYDAWRTRDRMAAELVAWATGGELVLFNPVVNQMKVI